MGSHRMSLSPWNEGSDSDHAAGMNRDKRLVGYRKIPAWQQANLPRYWREWAVEVRPLTAKKKLRASEARGLSGEAVKGNPTTRVIPGVDESKPSPRTSEDSTEPEKTYNPETVLFRRKCRVHPLCVMSDLRPNWNQARLLMHTRMPRMSIGRSRKRSDLPIFRT